MAWKGNWGQQSGAYGGKGGGGGGAWNRPASQGAAKGGNTIKPSTPPARPNIPAKPVVKSITPTSGAAKPTPGGKTPALTVASTSSKKEEIGVQTLVGDYTEAGSNHGRKYYQKVQEIPGHKDVKVFLYYWDMRDGNDFAGWWFGDELGGSQVWARCSSHGNVPPPAGWKIPWDAPKAEPGLLTVNPYKGKAGVSAATFVAKPVQPVAATGQTAAPSVASVVARVKKATAQVESLEKTSKEQVTKAKAMTATSPEAAMKQLQGTLTAEQNKLTEAQKSLTQDINEARKAGPSAVSSVTDLSKLSPRLRAASTSLATELNKIKGFVNQAAAKAKNAANTEAQKKQEEKNKTEFDEALPAVEEAVGAAEDAVEAVSIMAAPIINDPPEDAGASMKKVMDEIETAATTAQTKIGESRTTINTKLAAARAYAPETRKKALAEYTALQGKLAEAQKKLNPFKNFKKDFSQRVEAKKALADITEKLSSADLEVEKASMMTTGADQSQMSDEDVKSAEGLVTPARQALGSVSGLVETKLRAASGPMKDELTGIKTRLMESQKKVNEIAKVLKRQREGLELQSTYTTAHEKVDKAEDSLDKCSDAELSFLKGIEVLPADESEKAIKESTAAAAASSTLLNQATSYLTQKLQEVKRYSPETSKKATEELQELQKRLEAVRKKLTNFKNETQERKVTAMMAEAIDSVSTAEQKGKAVTEAAKVFESDIADTSVDALKAASAKTAAADKECQAALTAARKVIADKQKTEKDREAVAGLGKLTGRVNAVQQALSAAKRSSQLGDRLVKCKEVVTDAEAKLVDVEADVEKVVKLSKPEDEGLGVEKITDATILEMDTMSIASSKKIRVVVSLVASHMPGAPPAIKPTLEKLSARCKKAEASLVEVKQATKEQREQVLSQSYVKEGLEKTLAVEAALEKVNDAEAPYLKGIEVLPVEESKAAMTAADEVSKNVQTAITEARNLIAAKNLEIRKFDPKNAKASTEEFTKLTERVNSAAQKLGVFKKDTDARRKKAQLQEATEMVATVQVEVAKVSETMKPMMEKNPDDLSPEEASAMVKSLEDVEKAASKQVNDCRNFLNARSRDAAGDKDKMAIVTDLNAKVSAAQAELAKAKKLSGTHNEKLRCKALIQESGEKVKEAEAELEKATAACGPVLEQKCERFLVRNSVATLCAALQEQMEKKALTEEQMLKEVGGGKFDQAKFVALVGSIPEAWGREECSFSEERRISMFKTIDADADGIVNITEFKAMFCRKYTCVHSISVTDVFDIAESKTVCKLEVGQVVEGVGETKKADEGLPRLKCVVPGSETNEHGWVTMQGNSGTKYLELASPFKAFTAQLEKDLDVHAKSAGKVSGYLNNKVRDLMNIAKDSPLVPAKEELMKTKGKVSQVIQKIEGLKRQIQQAKGDYGRMELKEKNAHIEAKEQKEADAILAVAKPAVEKVEAELLKLEEAAKPLTSLLNTEGLKEFATPLTVQDQVKLIEEALKAAVAAGKTAVKEQQTQEVVIKAHKGPMLEAKKELQKWMAKVSQAQVSASKAASQVKACCSKIANAKFELAASTMRSEMQAANLSAEDLFKKLAKKGDRISEESFLNHVQGLAGLNLPLEHAMLLTRKIEVGGVGQRSFLRFVQKHLKVIKDIAITTSFDVIGCKDKPVRKAECDEVFEVLEGPKKDEPSGLDRVKVKALTDGVVGWASVKGNQGKVFMTECDKPFFQVLKDLALEKDFFSGSGDVRSVKSDEVLELIEGPRKETLGSVMRLRGKAVDDGKTGWMTLKDKSGKVYMEKSGKVYTCTATVAITDVFDIKTCKVLKKLSVDEVFTISEGPIAEEGTGVERVKGKSTKDDIEGWITVKGNAGTCYARVNEKLYTVTHEVAMQTKFNSDSSEVRKVTAQEAIEVLEGPREERFEPANRAKVRTSSDSAVGWISVKADSVRKWTPTYKFLKAGSIYAEKGSKDGVVREAGAGELLELQEGPVEVDGAMWLKGQMKKDGVLGWTPLKGEGGVKVLINSH